MNPEHKRIVELAAGWEDSDAVVSLSPGDAALVASVGAPVTPGKRAGDPSSIVGRELFAAAERLRATWVETPEGAQPTPNTLSVTGPGGGAVENDSPDDDPLEARTRAALAEGDRLDAMTVADLKELAATEAVELHGVTKKAEIIDAIRKARAAK